MYYVFNMFLPLVQPSKLKFLLGCHLATNSFGFTNQVTSSKILGAVVTKMVPTWRVVVNFVGFQNAIVGAVLNIILCIIDNSSPSISVLVAWVAGIRMGKEMEKSGVEKCAHGRREGRGTPTSIAGGGGQQDLGTKNHFFQGCH